MSTKAKNGEPEPTPQTTSEPEENLSTIADDPTFSAPEFDREHGDEVGAAVFSQWQHESGGKKSLASRKAQHQAAGSARR